MVVAFSRGRYAYVPMIAPAELFDMLRTEWSWPMYILFIEGGHKRRLVVAWQVYMRAEDQPRV